MVGPCPWAFQSRFNTDVSHRNDSRSPLFWASTVCSAQHREWCEVVDAEPTFRGPQRSWENEREVTCYPQLLPVLVTCCSKAGFEDLPPNNSVFLHLHQRDKFNHKLDSTASQVCPALLTQVPRASSPDIHVPVLFPSPLKHEAQYKWFCSYSFFLVYSVHH